MGMTVRQQFEMVEVKPVLPQRIQMWARLAGQAVSFADLNVVYTAFHALWWEADAANSFESAMSSMQEGSLKWAVLWLGHVIFELERTVEAWQRVVEALTADPGFARRMARFVKDTSTHLDEVRYLVAAVREQTVALCLEYGLPLPEQVQNAPALQVVEVQA